MFGFLRDSLKSEQMLLQFVLFRRAKIFNEIKQAYTEYSDNLKMMDGPGKSNEGKGLRFTVQNEPKDSRIEDLCKQVENLNLMVTKQPRSARQSEPVCYKCNKKGHYVSQCRFGQEPTCYRCNKKGHYASEGPIKPDPPVSCTYCHRKCYRAEDCFLRKNNESVDMHDLQTLRTNPSDGNPNKHLAKADNVMFVEQEYDEPAAAFEHSATGEKLTKEQRMQNNITEYSKHAVQTNPRTKFAPDLHALRKMGQRGKKTSRKLTGKPVIQELSKRIEICDLINNLAEAPAGITFAQIARGDIDFAKADL